MVMAQMIWLFSPRPLMAFFRLMDAGEEDILRHSGGA